MFGKNIVLKQVSDDDNGQLLLVKETFATLQGEGPHTGRPAIFVRLAGCNLRCHFCDTDFEGGEYVAERDLRRRVALLADRAIGGNGASLVVVTGGEPLRQNIEPFLDALVEESFDFQIETAGTLWVEGLEALCDGYESARIVCSPKTAKVHPAIEDLCNHWKYIVSPEDAAASDGLPCRSTQTKDNREAQPLYRAKHGTIWVQPRFDYNTAGMPDLPRNARNLEHAVALAMRYGYRVSLQAHRYYNLP
jgi:7-carboxy-7-deazaguanine synthase